MAKTFTTTVEELPESRVRLRVQVAPDEIERRLERRAGELGRSLKIPGFRRGKVPATLVLQRMGRQAVFEETIQTALGSWYAGALDSARIVPIGDPSIELTEMPAAGEPFGFSVEVGVLPKATVKRYKGLEVPRREPDVSDAAISEEVDRLRDRFARLEDVDRAAQTGDFLVVDYDATLDGDALEGAQGRDQLVELGAGRLLPSLETGLVGASAGETPEIVATFPADYPSNEIAGRQAIFTVAVKQVKEKRLPELDEDFAADTGFDTVEELRADIASRMTDAELERIDREFREAALDEVARDATVEVPAALITARAAEMWERTQRALARQGISRETYLQISGRDEAQLLAELAPDAEQALRREAVITAVVAAEGIVPSDDELLEVLAESADAHDHDHDHGAHDHDHGAHDHDHSAHADHDHDHGDHDPTIEAQKLMDELRRGGRLEELRDELAARHAVDLIARESKPIAAERAEARARLWTPDKEGGDGLQDPSSTPSGAQSGPGAAPKRLWTPGA